MEGGARNQKLELNLNVTTELCIITELSRFCTHIPLLFGRCIDRNTARYSVACDAVIQGR